MTDALPAAHCHTGTNKKSCHVSHFGGKQWIISRSTGVLLLINGSPTEVVDSLKYLATTSSSGLDREANIGFILMNALQRMFFLRQGEKSGPQRKIPVQFYRGVIDTVPCLSLTVWYGGTTRDQKKRLDRVVKNAQRIIASELYPYFVLINVRFSLPSLQTSTLVLKPTFHAKKLRRVRLIIA